TCFQINHATAAKTRKTGAATHLRSNNQHSQNTVAPTTRKTICARRLRRALVCDPRCLEMRPGFTRYGILRENRLPALRLQGNAKRIHAMVAASTAGRGVPRRKPVMTSASSATRAKRNEWNRFL